jgi:hypothetical protein
MKNFAITRDEHPKGLKVIHEFSAIDEDQAKEIFFNFLALEYFEREGKLFDGAGNKILERGECWADDGQYVLWLN